MFMAERQSVRMSKIENEGLTWSGTGLLIAVPMATVGVNGQTVKGLKFMKFISKI